MTNHLPEDLDEQLEIVGGRKAPYTTVPDWVSLHTDLDPQAKALYNVLAAHVNVARGDGKVWPTRLALAEMLGFSREQSVDKYIKQLVAVGAIDTEEIRRSNGAKGVRYTVHQVPPDNYSGPQTLAAWYQRRKETLAAAGSKRKPGRPRKAAASAAQPAEETPAAHAAAPAAVEEAKKHPEPGLAEQAPAKKAAVKKAAPTEKTEEQQKAEELGRRADKGAHLWWDEKAPALVEARLMPRLTGTKQQRSRKFLAVRGLIRGALEAGYDPRQILGALEDVKQWLPSAQQFDAALGRQDGVHTQAGGSRQPMFRNEQWQQDKTEEGVPTAPPGLDVFGVDSQPV